MLRFQEVRYSMFYALFAFCALLPLVQRLQGSRADEADPWKTVEKPLRS